MNRKTEKSRLPPKCGGTVTLSNLLKDQVEQKGARRLNLLFLPT